DSTVDNCRTSAASTPRRTAAWPCIRQGWGVSLLRATRKYWFEADWLALPETHRQLELFDGKLFLAPRPNAGHQISHSRVQIRLTASARAAGLRVTYGLGVRLGRDRMAIPDVSVLEPVSGDTSVVEAAIVQLVAEVTSRGNLRHDRVRKMNYYAAAGIPH